MNSHELPRWSSNENDPLDDVLAAIDENDVYLLDPPKKKRQGTGREQVPPLKRRRDGLVVTRASELEVKPVMWVSAGRIPLGAITVLAGDPGLGKSLLAALIASAVTRGEVDCGEGRVVILTGEDSPERTVRPRLEAAHARLERVTFVATESDGLTLPLVLPDDVPAIAEHIRDDCRLVIIDPLSVHLARGINSWKDTEVRRALAPLAALADSCQVAFLIVAHLNKSQSDDPLQRLGGSIGIAAAARSVLLLARDPDDPDGETGSRRVMAQAKSNLGPFAKSTRYEIKTTTSNQGGEIIETALMELIGDVRYTARELLAAPAAERGSKLGEAEQFLRKEVAHGPVAVSTIKQHAHELGISEQTLKRAKDQLHIISEKPDFAAGWTWRLPEAEPNPVGDEREPTPS